VFVSTFGFLPPLPCLFVELLSYSTHLIDKSVLGASNRSLWNDHQATKKFDENSFDFTQRK